MTRVIDQSRRMTTVIRVARSDDAAAIAAIYNTYVRDDIATFEEVPVAVDEMNVRVADVQKRGLPWLVAEDAGTVIGYAYAGPWKARSAYRHTVEASVYVDRATKGRGIGAELYAALLAELRTRDIHAVIGGVSLPNEASARLHEKFGFKNIARFEQVGFKLGRWIDVGYWQLLL
jgi:phosphinothricin acetyltransferase